MTDITVNDKKITPRIYRDNNVLELRKKIETALNIPGLYQLIYTDDDVVVGIKDLVMPDDFMTWKGSTEKREVVLYTLIPQEVRNFNVISLVDYVNSIEHIETLSMFDMKQIYGTIAVFWPFVKYERFKAIVDGRDRIRSRQFDFNYERRYYESMGKIKRRGLTIDKYNIVKINIITRIELDMNYLFDRFAANPTYHSILYRSEGGNIIMWKYHIDFEDKKYDYPKRTSSIKVNDDIVLHGDEIRHSDNKFVEIVKSILNVEPLSSTNILKYHFLVQFDNGRFDAKKYNTIIEGFDTRIVKRDPIISNYYAMYYKRVNVMVDIESDDLYGAYIRLRGSSIISIEVSNIHKASDMKLVYEFVIGTLYMYHRRYVNPKVPAKLHGIKGLLKLMDPVLYGYKGKEIADSEFKLYSRRVARVKYPMVFHEGSNIWKKWKNKGINSIKYKNFSHERDSTLSKKNIYLCINPKYKYIHLRPPYEHPRGVCTVSCSVKDKSKRAMHKKCLEGVKFDLDDIVDTDEDTSNVYYIRRFTYDKILNRKKLSFAPDQLHKYINPKCNVTNNILELGSSCYLLMGGNNNFDFYETIGSVLPKGYKTYYPKDPEKDEWTVINNYYKRKINVISLYYNIDDDDIGIKRFISYYSLLKLIDTMSTIYVINVFSEKRQINRYNVIVQLSLLKRKKQTVTSIFKGHPINTMIKHLISTSLANEQDRSNFVTLYDIVLMKEKGISEGNIDMIQMKVGESNLITKVLIRHREKNYVVFPILPSFLNIHHEYIDNDDMKAINKYLPSGGSNMNDIVDIIHIFKDKIRIKSIISRNKIGTYTGFYLNNDYIIKFNDTKEYPKKIKYKIGDSIMYYDVDDIRKPDGLKYINDSSEKDKELYYVLLVHVSHFLNVRDRELKRVVSRKKLTERYGSEKHPYFVSDYNKLVRGDIESMEYFRTIKVNIMLLIERNEKNLIKKINKELHSLMDEHVKFMTKGDNRVLTGDNYRKLCEESGGKSVENQCHEGKLLLVKSIYYKFIDLIARELVFNETRRYEIFNNMVSRTIEYRKYSEIDDNVIKKIYDDIVYTEME